MAHETAGAARIRLSLRPLVFERVKIDAKLGRIAPRERGRTSSRCLTIESEILPRHCEPTGRNDAERATFRNLSPSCSARRTDWRPSIVLLVSAQGETNIMIKKILLGLTVIAAAGVAIA